MGQFLNRTAPSKQNSAVKSLKCMSERSVLDSGNYRFPVKSIFLKTSSSTPMLTDFFLTFLSLHSGKHLPDYLFLASDGRRRDV